MSRRKREPVPPWASSEATCTRARALIDGVDEAERQAAQEWGAGRLRLLVPHDLRARFDARASAFERAVLYGTLAELEEQATKMGRAWRALDRAAREAGADPLAPVVWEHTMPDGRVVAVVRSETERLHVISQGRRVDVYTLSALVEAALMWSDAALEPIDTHDGEEVLRPANDRLWKPQPWEMASDGD